MEVSSTGFAFPFCTFLPLASSQPRVVQSRRAGGPLTRQGLAKLSESLTITFLNWEEISEGKRRSPPFQNNIQDEIPTIIEPHSSSRSCLLMGNTNCPEPIRYPTMRELPR